MREIQKQIVLASLSACIHYALKTYLGFTGMHSFAHSFIHGGLVHHGRESRSLVRVGLPPRGRKASRRCRGGRPSAADAPLLSPTKQLLMFLTKSKTQEQAYKRLAQGALCFIPLFPGLLSRASWTSGSAASQRQQAPGRSATCSSARPRTQEVPGKVSRIRESSVGKISSFGLFSSKVSQPQQDWDQERSRSVAGCGGSRSALHRSGLYPCVPVAASPSPNRDSPNCLKTLKSLGTAGVLIIFYSVVLVH